MRVGKQVTIFDGETGEVFHESVSFGTQNGDGWVIVYRDTYMGLILSVPDLTTLKVFGSLMAKQEFENGIKITKQAIANELGISYRSVIKAFKWLKENCYIKETKRNGVPEFFLNPYVTTCGKNKKNKIKAWESI